MPRLVENMAAAGLRQAFWRVIEVLPALCRETSAERAFGA